MNSHTRVAQARPLAGHRLVALDLDGTVLGPDGRVSARTARAVKAVLALGVEVTPVTARVPAAVLHPALRMGLRGEAICAGGATRMDLRTGRLSEQQHLSAEHAREVARRIRQRCGHVTFGWVHDEGITVERAYPYPHQDRVVGTVDTLVYPVITLFGRCDGPCARRLVTDARTAIEGVADLGHTDAAGDAAAPRSVLTSADAAESSAPVSGYAEVVKPGVCKLAALRRLCADRGLRSSHVLAFGNGAADADMLRWAGHGVAVGDSDPAALAAADRVTDRCGDDGVATVLEELVELCR